MDTLNLHDDFGFHQDDGALLNADLFDCRPVSGFGIDSMDTSSTHGALGASEPAGLLGNMHMNMNMIDRPDVFAINSGAASMPSLVDNSTVDNNPFNSVPLLPTTHSSPVLPIQQQTWNSSPEWSGCSSGTSSPLQHPHQQHTLLNNSGDSVASVDGCSFVTQQQQQQQQQQQMQQNATTFQPSSVFNTAVASFTATPVSADRMEEESQHQSPQQAATTTPPRTADTTTKKAKAAPTKQQNKKAATTTTRKRKRRRKSELPPDQPTALTLDRETLLKMTLEEYDNWQAEIIRTRIITQDEEKDLKRQRRLVKNRESAAASRNRKKSQMEEMEQTIAELRTDNDRLRRRVTHLEKENRRLLDNQIKQQVNQISSPLSDNSIQNSTDNSEPSSPLDSSFVANLADAWQSVTTIKRSNVGTAGVCLMVMLFSFGLFTTPTMFAAQPNGAVSVGRVVPARVFVDVPSSVVGVPPMAAKRGVAEGVMASGAPPPLQQQQPQPGARQLLEFEAESSAWPTVAPQNDLAEIKVQTPMQQKFSDAHKLSDSAEPTGRSWLQSNTTGASTDPHTNMTYVVCQTSEGLNELLEANNGNKKTNSFIVGVSLDATTLQDYSLLDAHCTIMANPHASTPQSTPTHQQQHEFGTHQPTALTA